VVGAPEQILFREKRTEESAIASQDARSDSTAAQKTGAKSQLLRSA
jgi:hypothetical protein